MKRLLLFALGFFLLGSCALFAAPQSDEKKDFALHRGTNISHWLSQSPIRGDERAQFFTRNDVARLASYGFDHIRLPIDEEQLWDEDGIKIPIAWQLLHNALQWCQAYNLRVIVDLHIIRSHHFNASNDGGKNTLFEDPTQQEKLVQLWNQLSDGLKRYPNSLVAYECMNEPVAPKPEQWNQLLTKLYNAVRSREPERVLVIGSNMWQSADTFNDLQVPANDPNIILSFHFYAPMLLSHLRAGWNEFKNHKGTVHYPGVMVTPEEYAVLSPSNQALVADFTKVWNRDTLYRLMEPAINKAKQLHLPLYCGEFGIIASAPREDAWAWYKDMLSLFDQYGIAWATWDYKGGFGFFKRDGSGFADETLLHILMQKD